MLSVLSMADDEAKPAPKIIEAPMAGWVRGGTESGAEEKRRQMRAADAAERRAKQDAAYQKTRESPEEARLASMRLGAPDGQYSVVLAIREGKNLDAARFVMCELSAQPKDDDPDDVELILIMACMRCIYRHHRPVDESNLKIHQSNRMFTLGDKIPKWQEEKWKSPLWVNPEDPSESCMVVGSIHMHERAHCAACNWTFTIDDSVVITIN